MPSNALIMKNLRPAITPLVLLLALACSGLQVLCAPIAEAAPMPCHVASACGDEVLQAGCCCLRPAAKFVPPAEQPAIPMPAVGVAAAVHIPPRSSALRPRPSRVPQPHPPLFQLYCSFLI